MTMGYTLPKSLTQKFMVEKLRVYFTAQNPFIFTNYTGIDPEAAKVNAAGNLKQTVVVSVLRVSALGFLV